VTSDDEDVPRKKQEVNLIGQMQGRRLEEIEADIIMLTQGSNNKIENLIRLLSLQMSLTLLTKNKPPRYHYGELLLDPTSDLWQHLIQHLSHSPTFDIEERKSFTRKYLVNVQQTPREDPAVGFFFGRTLTHKVWGLPQSPVNSIVSLAFQ